MLLPNNAVKLAAPLALVFGERRLRRSLSLQLTQRQSPQQRTAGVMRVVGSAARNEDV